MQSPDALEDPFGEFGAAAKPKDNNDEEPENVDADWTGFDETTEKEEVVDEKSPADMIKLGELDPIESSAKPSSNEFGDFSGSNQT